MGLSGRNPAVRPSSPTPIETGTRSVGQHSGAAGAAHHESSPTGGNSGCADERDRLSGHPGPIAHRPAGRDGPGQRGVGPAALPVRTRGGLGAVARRRRPRRAAMAGGRGHHGLRRRVGVHQDVRAPGPSRQGRSRGGRRRHQHLLRAAPRRRLPVRRQPHQVRRRRPPPALHRRGPCHPGRARRRRHALAPAHGGPARHHGRTGGAADLHRRPQRHVPPVPGGGLAPRADRGRAGRLGHRGGGGISHRRRDRDECADCRPPARPQPGAGAGPWPSPPVPLRPVPLAAHRGLGPRRDRPRALCAHRHPATPPRRGPGGRTPHGDRGVPPLRRDGRPGGRTGAGRPGRPPRRRC